MKKWIVMAVLAACTGAVYADDVNGLLEKGKNGSVIYDVSPESGDVMAYYFSHKTKVGAKVKATCIDGMYCHVEGLKADENSAVKTEFDIQASVIFVAKGDAQVGIGSAFDTYENEAETRFGTLRINDDNELVLKKQKLKSPIEVNSGLSIAFVTEMGDKDVVVLRNAGGTACPELFTVMSLSAKGYQFSQEFGSCSGYVMVSFDKADNLKIDMTDFRGPFESEKEQLAALQRKVSYVYQKNGKLIEPAVKK